MPNMKEITASILEIDQEKTWNASELASKKKAELETILVSLEKLETETSADETETTTETTTEATETAPVPPAPAPTAPQPFRVGSIIIGPDGAKPATSQKVEVETAEKSTGKGFLQIRLLENLILTDEVKAALPHLVPPPKRRALHSGERRDAVPCGGS